MYQNFVGIDIGKEISVVGQAEQKQTQEFVDSLDGFQACYENYKHLLDSTLVVLEAMRDTRWN